MLRTCSPWGRHRRAGPSAPRGPARSNPSRRPRWPGRVAPTSHFLDQPSPQTIPTKVDEVEERRGSLLSHDRRLGQVVHPLHDDQSLQARRDVWQVRSRAWKTSLNCDWIAGERCASAPGMSPATSRSLNRFQRLSNRAFTAVGGSTRTTVAAVNCPPCPSLTVAAGKYNPG